jgi:hypothetical protein
MSFCERMLPDLLQGLALDVRLAATLDSGFCRPGALLCSEHRS